MGCPPIGTNRLLVYGTNGLAIGMSYGANYTSSNGANRLPSRVPTDYDKSGTKDASKDWEGCKRSEAEVELS